MSRQHDRDNPWYTFSGINLAYLHDLYESYEQDPMSVDQEWRESFDQYGAPPLFDEQEEQLSPIPQPVASTAQTMHTVVAASNLVTLIRTYGHLAADVYPEPVKIERDVKAIDPARHKLTRAELEQIPATVVWEHATNQTRTAWDAIQELTSVYTKSTAYQFSHVNETEERNWLTRKVEAEGESYKITDADRQNLLYRLLEVENFELFLQRSFVGQKRFSVEGLDMLVPILDEIVHLSVMHEETENIMIGMAHRGRLNVLAHVLGKPYEAIFSEFHQSPNIDLIPSEGSIGINFGWTGDVKYHLGANRAVPKQGKEVRQVRVSLANNPSHLEFVDPIVQGFARAAQEDRSQSGLPKQDVDKAIPVLIHGDAAFPGEGVVAETLNLSKLKGYQVGGTIHIIANNNVGFTTDTDDARSTEYSSDLVKGFEIPTVHVNADDPEACIAAITLAYEYRNTFHKDFLVDLIGYRRFGHNESDDPVATQPDMYAKIKKHKTTATLYAEKLVQQNIVKPETIEQWKQEIQAKLEASYDRMKAALDSKDDNGNGSLRNYEPEDPSNADYKTGVTLDVLNEINQKLLQFPDHFKPYPKLERILRRRASALDEGNAVEWALAESLAFATILRDGKAIRMTGQDIQRGTFAHRHLVLHDVDTNKLYAPLQNILGSNASLALHNSPLSEIGVLGFEYGYNVFSPETLVIWEAQFGDFVNTAQVIIDQFLSAGKAKWGQLSGLVMLLPHGYEGQGPEHSSARLERFLQSSAENNWFVCNPTSSAQYFHLLRRQSKLLGTEQMIPLIVMTPKSLLRHPMTGSAGTEFEKGTFKLVLEQEGSGKAKKQVKRLILCSGKIAIDLEAKLNEMPKKEKDAIHVVRVEQLYPFPAEDISAIVERYTGLEELVWVQEEPKNMGAWTFMEPRLRELSGDKTVRYVGRPGRSSTAEGMPDAHQVEQDRIVAEALTISKQ